MFMSFQRHQDYFKKQIANQSGSVLMVAIVLSLVVGLISAGILTVQQNKNKTSESANVKISAENFRNKLIMA